MDGPTFRKVVWEEMLFANMRSSYFAELVSHYLWIDKALRLFTLVATSGTVGSVLIHLQNTEVRLIPPLAAAATSFWFLISQYGSLARDASDLHGGWSGVAHDYEQLWNDLGAVDAEAKYHQIYERAEVLSKSGTKFPNKKRRLNYWLDQAAMLASSRYA